MDRTRRIAARPRRAAALVVVVVATVMGVAPGPAHAQEGTERPDAETYRNLAAQVARNERELGALTERLAAAEARLVELAAELGETNRRLEVARSELARMQQIVRARAAFLYSRGRAPGSLVTDIERVEDLASGRRYAESATRTDVRRITELTAVVEALDRRRAELEDAVAVQTNERDRIQRARDDLDTLLARQKRALDAAGAVTVMGAPELDARQIAAWFHSRGVRSRLWGNTTIEDLAQLYVEEGATEQVRPELAFVQAVLETGSFGNATDNNFAGIGACDSCTGQIPFATPRDGVRGQIQMLRNYADPWSRAADLAHPPSAPIYGSDPVRAAHNYDTFFAKGVAPTWNLMGDGNWATDPDYATKVLTLYFQLMAHATRRP